MKKPNVGHLVCAPHWASFGLSSYRAIDRKPVDMALILHFRFHLYLPGESSGLKIQYYLPREIIGNLL